MKYRMELSSAHGSKKGDSSTSSLVEEDIKREKLDMTIRTNRIIEERSHIEEQYGVKPIVLWEDLNIKDKVKLFGYWSLISIIANVLQLFGSLSNIMSVYST